MEVFSFEKSVPENIIANGEIKISQKHYKDGKNSLMWKTMGEAKLVISTEIGYKPFDETAKSKARCSFLFWIYQETSLNDDMFVEFGNGASVDCYFAINMNFTGWRTVWVPYEQMEGTPSENMNSITMRLNLKQEHTIFFDQIIPMQYIDSRHHMRDYQVPFVNLRADTAANSHWMSLYHFALLYNENTENTQDVSLQEQNLAEMQILENRYFEILKAEFKYPTNDKISLWWDDIGEAEDFYKMLCIKNEDGYISGKTIIFSNQNAVYPPEHSEELTYITAGIGIKLCCDFLLNLAQMWNCAEDSQKNQIEKMYINTVLHLIDQGWAYGSGLGTVHHLGYSTRGFYSSVFLMRDVLKKFNLLEQVRKISMWFSGAGRMFRPENEFIGESCDTFNTLLLPIIASVLIDENTKRKHVSLLAIKKWLDTALMPAPGVKGVVKIDGSAFHHANHYPAYAMGAFKGVSPTVYMLSKTSYALSDFSHGLLRKAVLAMRIYSNSLSWPVALSARHPVGDGDRGQISTFDPFYYMALAGNPIKNEQQDTEMITALLRLMQYRPFAKGEKFIEAGFCAEKTPTGHFSMNYACSAFHRRGEWLACVRGHSKYIWGNETYLANNLYGRYIAYGSLQILSKGKPISHKESGYVQKGWDWNFWPGTTAVALPMEKLKADVCNVDELSGFEEMLLSDKAFVGGVNLLGQDGVFAMDLHSHAKYDATHVAKKSYFFFGNKIICIGSDISNDNTSGNTYTTLFQNYLMNKNDAIFIDETEINDSEFTKKTANCTALYDNCSNGFYIKSGQNVLVTKGLQNSCDQNTGTQTQGYFAKALIEHGAKPKGESYEYCIFVDVTKEQMQKNIQLIRADNMYKTLQANSKLHCVYDCESASTAYVLWEGVANLNFAHLKAVSDPMLIVEKNIENGFALAVSDPDLRLYDGVEADQIDEDGLQKEVSLYSRKWVKSPSAKKDISLVVHGIWDIESTEQSLKAIKDTANNETTIYLTVCDGLSYQIYLRT